MWVRLGFQNFIIKKIVSDDDCTIFVSNFLFIWHKTISFEDLASTAKTMNPLFEASQEKLKELTLNLFDDEQNTHKEIEKKENEILLKLESTKFGVKFKFQVLLNKGDEEMLYNEFTLPLLIMILRMQNKENTLIKIIKDKDAEIKEYKEEHGETKASSYAATKPFVESNFKNEESLNPSLDSIINNASIFLDFIDKTLFLYTKTSTIKQEKQTSLSVSEERNVVDNCNSDNKEVIFKNKNSYLRHSFEPCVKLSHQSIKKRKKNEVFKIKF